jgi:hypothetical protein
VLLLRADKCQLALAAKNSDGHRVHSFASADRGNKPIGFATTARPSDFQIFWVAAFRDARTRLGSPALHASQLLKAKAKGLGVLFESIQRPHSRLGWQTPAALAQTFTRQRGLTLCDLQSSTPAPIAQPDPRAKLKLRVSHTPDKGWRQRQRLRVRPGIPRIGDLRL